MTHPLDIECRHRTSKTSTRYVDQCAFCREYFCWKCTEHGGLRQQRTLSFCSRDCVDAFDVANAMHELAGDEPMTRAEYEELGASAKVIVALRKLAE